MNKIRGVTVGTTMSPDKVAEKSGLAKDVEDLKYDLAEHKSLTINPNPHKISCDTIKAAKQEDFSKLDSSVRALTSALDTHKQSTNPHKITCKEIDAVHIDELRDRVSALLESNGVTGHLLSAENPHKVTCQQIGAATQDELNIETAHFAGLLDAEIVIVNDTINDHIQAKNPHSVTAAQIGAAEAGFGLGENKAHGTNWNTSSRGAFLRGADNSPDGTMWYGLNCINGEKDACSAQIAFKQLSSDEEKSLGVLTIEARRTKNAAGTAWSQWEYVNPPMLEGVEYRTTERYNGKPVYAKLVNLVKEPGNNNHAQEIIASSVDCIVDVKLSVYVEGRSCFNLDEVAWHASVAYDGNLVCFCDSELEFTASALAKYTKE